MEKSPLAKSSHYIDDETSERTFKIWDNNADGFIEPVEVSIRTTNEFPNPVSRECYNFDLSQEVRCKADKETPVSDVLALTDDACAWKRRFVFY